MALKEKWGTGRAGQQVHNTLKDDGDSEEMGVIR